MNYRGAIINDKYLERFRHYFKSRCLFLIGVSNSGKSTLSNKIIGNKINFKIIPTITTRNKRDNDTDIETNFLSNEEFVENIRKQRYFYRNFKNSTWYGYSIMDLQCIISEDKIPIFCFQGEGAFAIKKVIRNIPSILLDCDLASVLKRNLEVKKRVDATQIAIDLQRNRAQFDYYKSVEQNSFIINNNTYSPPISPEVVDEVLSIIGEVFN